MNKKAFYIIIITVLIFNNIKVFSQEEVPYSYPFDPSVAQKLEDWKDWKFGVIIHWGAYSEWGVVESWSLCPEDESWCIRRGEFADDYYKYTSEYEKIRYNFNPQNFNPDKWAAACKNAGMKYLVFTTKHHDGFCMYDSKYTDYKITDSASAFSSNPKSNVVKEVFDAFRDQDMGIGAYFSKPDWHNDDYWWPYFPVFDRNVNYDPEKYPEKWQSFKNYTYNQIEELMTDYGNIDILWLDGGWVRPAGSLTEETKPWLGKNQWIQDVGIDSIAQMTRQKQEGILIVDRTVHGKYENYRTPEQQIPEDLPPYPWESCITLGYSWYSTKPNDEYKSSDWVIHTLVKIVSHGGNFLLGIGPDKTGDLVPEVYDVLAKTGEWMELNSDCIYETKPLFPYKSDKLYFTQSKDEKTKYIIYLMDNNDDIPDKITIPESLKLNNQKITLLGVKGNLKLKSNIIKLPTDLDYSKLKSAMVFVVK